MKFEKINSEKFKTLTKDEMSKIEGGRWVAMRWGTDGDGSFCVWGRYVFRRYTGRCTTSRD